MPKIVHVGYRSPLATSVAWLKRLGRRASSGVRLVSSPARR